MSTADSRWRRKQARDVQASYKKACQSQGRDNNYFTKKDKAEKK